MAPSERVSLWCLLKGEIVPTALAQLFPLFSWAGGSSQGLLCGRAFSTLTAPAHPFLRSGETPSSAPWLNAPAHPFGTFSRGVGGNGTAFLLHLKEGWFLEMSLFFSSPTMCINYIVSYVTM